MTTFNDQHNRRYDLAESWGNGAHHIGHELSYEELPPLAKAAVDADPEADEWKVPIPDTPGLNLEVMLCEEEEEEEEEDEDCKYVITIFQPIATDGTSAFTTALEQCYGGDLKAYENDKGRAMQEVLIKTVYDAGLTFIAATDFAARWWGTEAQLNQVQTVLPSWACVEVADE